MINAARSWRWRWRRARHGKRTWQPPFGSTPLHDVSRIVNQRSAPATMGPDGAVKSCSFCARKRVEPLRLYSFAPRANLRLARGYIRQASYIYSPSNCNFTRVTPREPKTRVSSPTFFLLSLSFVSFDRRRKLRRFAKSVSYTYRSTSKNGFRIDKLGSDGSRYS